MKRFHRSQQSRFALQATRAVALLSCLCGKVIGQSIDRSGAADMLFRPPPADSGDFYEPEQDASTSFTIQRDMPHRPQPIEPIHDYNIKYGRWTARFDGSMGIQYNDNVNLVDAGGQNSGPNDDLTLTPSLGISIAHPISKYNGFRLDISIGYASHLNYPQLDGLRIGPRSSMDFHSKIGDVTLTLFDDMSSSSDAATRTEIVGTGNPSSVNFQRFVNTIGASAFWNPTRMFSLSAGASYSLERGLSDSFSQLDRDSRQFTIAAYQRLHDAVTVGLSSFYNDYSYPKKIQNDGAIYGVGPLVSWSPNRFLNVNAAAHYTITQFGKTGTIQDTQEYAGLTYDLTVSHVLSREVTHALTFSKNINTGYGSNFTDLLSLSYRLNWTVDRKTGFSFNSSFQQSKQSAGKFALPQSQLPFILLGGEEIIQYPVGSSVDPATGMVLIPVSTEAADIYQVGVGLTRQIGRRLSSGLGISRIMRETSARGLSYSQDTVTLTINYRF